MKVKRRCVELCPADYCTAVAVVLALCGCQSGNLTTLEDAKLMARTTTANQARMSPDGNLTANYQGIGATQTMTEPNAIWAQLQGPAGIVTFPMPNGTVQVISPKDIVCKGLKYTPEPAKGAAQLEIAEFSANISVPMAQEVAALEKVMVHLTTMNKDAILGDIERMKAVGEMLPTIADALVAIISKFAPVP